MEQFKNIIVETKFIIISPAFYFFFYLNIYLKNDNSIYFKNNFSLKFKTLIADINIQIIYK